MADELRPVIGRTIIRTDVFACFIAHGGLTCNNPAESATQPDIYVNHTQTLNIQLEDEILIKTNSPKFQNDRKQHEDQDLGRHTTQCTREGNVGTYVNFGRHCIDILCIFGTNGSVWADFVIWGCANIEMEITCLVQE